MLESVSWTCCHRLPWVPLRVHRVTVDPPMTVRTDRLPILGPYMWYQKEKHDGSCLGVRIEDIRSATSPTFLGRDDSRKMYEPEHKKGQFQCFVYVYVCACIHTCTCACVCVRTHASLRGCRWVLISDFAALREFYGKRGLHLQHAAVSAMLSWLNFHHRTMWPVK